MLMLVDGPRHGYEIMQAISRSTGGAWRPSPGAVYPTIGRLHEEGLVTIQEADGRRLVSLTAAGRGDVKARTDRSGDPLEHFEPTSASADLASALGSVVAATEQVGANGSSAQAIAALQLLTATRRSLYLILAGDGLEAG